MVEMRSSAVLAVLGLVVLYAVQTSWMWITGANTPEAVMQGMELTEAQMEQTKIYRQKQLIQVTEGVHVTVGFSMANSILLEGPDGLIIIDTTLNLDSAKEILEQFRNVSDKPIRAIIYTHFHPDHTYGAQSFIEDPENPPDIWAHEEFLSQMRITAVTGKAGFMRAQRQFGIYLPSTVEGNFLNFDTTFESATVFPNKLVTGKMQAVNIAGIDLELHHLPGETDDHLVVYWPEKRVVCPGDNIYRAFPNLYAIRGTPNRDVLKWAASVNGILALQAEHLVPSHTHPISGQEEIRDILTVYRDAIQYVHDQTVRYMNKGMHPHDIVELVQLPPNMVDHPYLQPLYGTVPWSVRGVFDTYMGWFSGDVVELSPMSTLDKATHMVELGGGRKNMMKKAQKAFDSGEIQWALELSSAVFQVYRDFEAARQLRVACLKHLANQQTSANGRMYHLSQAIEDYNFGAVKGNPKKMIQRLPMSVIFDTMAVNVNAEKCYDRNTVAVFEFTDTEESYGIHLRNGIMVRLGTTPEKWDVKLTTTGVVWRGILAKERSPLTSYATGDLVIEGGVLAFRAFIGCLDRDL